MRVPFFSEFGGVGELTFDWDRLAYHSGVTTAVSAPVSRGMFSGASVAFRTGAGHKLEEGAIVNVSQL